MNILFIDSLPKVKLLLWPNWRHFSVFELVASEQLEEFGRKCLAIQPVKTRKARKTSEYPNRL
jgi:hypothetical protein